MNSRRFTLVAAVAAGALAVTGCSAPSDSGEDAGPVELTFWSWVPGIDAAVDLWNEENPDVQVTLEAVPAGSNGTYAKIYSALQAGSGAPDISQVEYQEMPGFVLEGGLIDLAPLGMAEQADEFIDWQVSQTTFGDAIYGVPQASGPMGLYYREDIFAELGLEPPTTWEEYADVARVVHASDPDRYLNTFPPANSAWFTALAWQAGAEWFGLDGDTWTVNIDSPETMKVAEYWQGLLDEGVVATEPDFANGWYAALQESRIVGWPSAQWGGAVLAGNAPDTSGLWRVAPLPQWSDATEFASANWGGSATAVLEGTEHPEEAYAFSYWLNTDPESIDLLIAGGYGWPSTKDGLEGSALDVDEEFLGGQNANRDVFVQSDQSINNDWGWIPTTSATYTYLNDGFSAAIAGEGTLMDVVRGAQEQTIKDLEAKGLKVRAGS
ncbi:extracellular solute-binding protein [Microbacterium sp. ET2]|uniref:ABC transporter substrate-binding protein n=1 Tax=Microbacterium albipurpureum TaxID=3050384 RepID=UPI00259C7C82|nr:extracellular solute-binding protein [Microbacterium sp. ET2 (Ac-2212)]WJL96977.1 extracellular solute-binding protein [Microbacterium sp. ET2 (Ac-2212)]